VEALRLVAAAAVRAVPAGEAPEIPVADRVADPARAVVEGDPVGETAGVDQVVRVVRAVTRETVLVVRAATVMTGRAGPSAMTTGLVVRVVTVMTVRVVPVVMMTVHRAGRSVTRGIVRAAASVMMTGRVVRVVMMTVVRVAVSVMMTGVLVVRAAVSVMMTVRRAGRSVTMTVHPGRSASRVPRLSVASAR